MLARVLSSSSPSLRVIPFVYKQSGFISAIPLAGKISPLTRRHLSNSTMDNSNGLNILHSAEKNGATVIHVGKNYLEPTDMEKNHPEIREALEGFNKRKKMYYLESLHSSSYILCSFPGAYWVFGMYETQGLMTSLPWFLMPLSLFALGVGSKLYADNPPPPRELVWREVSRIRGFDEKETETIIKIMRGER
jgi:hypothetical protein